MLREITSNLWAIETPFELMGMNMGARMTIACRSNGDLFAYAPFSISDEDEAAIREKGEVRDIVAPSPGHYTGIKDFAGRFPDATLWVLPGLEKKVEDIPHRILEKAPERWKEDFDCLLFDGPRFASEWVFCHKTSRSLLVTDLGFHLPRPVTPVNRIAARLNDVGRRFGTSRVWRTMMKLGDKPLELKHVQTMLGWDFERIVPGHGFVITEKPKAKLRAGFRFLGVK